MRVYILMGHDDDSKFLTRLLYMRSVHGILLTIRACAYVGLRKICVALLQKLRRQLPTESGAVM